mmetsp:Transcript_6508/g.11239  ORF Transcript_6508/g.11239 Transcript_6508/m.11239 type:complete len:209 (-) Transcript_6508:1827-2453(-)
MPELPFKANILQSVRQCVAVIYWHQLVLATSGVLIHSSLADQDISTVSISICHAKVQHRDLVNLLHIETSSPHLLTVPGTRHILLQRASLGENLFIRPILATFYVRKSCWRYARETIMVQDVRGHFASRPLPDDGAFPHTLANVIASANVPARVVDSHGLLVHWLEHCTLGTIRVTQEVCAASPSRRERRRTAEHQTSTCLLNGVAEG